MHRYIVAAVVVIVIIYVGCTPNAEPTAPDMTTERFLGADLCSQCHQEKGNQWRQTGHYHALEDLLASDNAADTCLPCHTVGLDGNPANSGYDDPSPIIAEKFGGVQCESCHGPAGNHTLNFEPLDSPLGADVCGACHDGEHHPTYTEWQESKHATAIDARDLSTHFETECLRCHSADYIFADSIPEDATPFDFEYGITCVVCHDPHLNENEYQLRAPVKELCGQCHTSEDASPGDSVHHSTVEMLEGSGGYEYAFGTYNNSYHTQLDESCVACHMYTAPFVEEGTPALSGHTWEPQIDACKECHPTLETFDRDGKQTEIMDLLAELQAELDLATDEDKLTASYANAKFNADFVEAEGSHGIHNYRYAKALLEDSIGDFVPGGEPPIPTGDYVGSQACSFCHSDIHGTWFESGHKYKLNKVEGAAPEYPFSSLPDTPAILSGWEDVTYVIGGFGWKARFIGTDGYIVTGNPGDGVQYNLATQGWVEYHPGEQKPYDCGRCHTTGWMSFDDNGGINQDDLPGLLGTWAEPGVACEACHGPASNHVAGPQKSNILKDDSAELCGQCHTRDAENRVLVSGNFVRHHEQYDEFLGSPHAGILTCNTCHDPHASTLYDGQAMGTGVTMHCTDCHAASSHQVSGAMGGLDCTECHMPMGAKSAVATGEGLHQKGDIHNHIWAIDTSGKTFDNYFSTDGSNTWITPDGEGKIELNLAWACMQCHNGINASTIDSYTLLANRADGIHD